jgi:hypothetical protein
MNDRMLVIYVMPGLLDEEIWNVTSKWFTTRTDLSNAASATVLLVTKRTYAGI